MGKADFLHRETDSGRGSGNSRVSKSSLKQAFERFSRLRATRQAMRRQEISANDSHAGLLEETELNRTGFDNLTFDDNHEYDDPNYLKDEKDPDNSIDEHQARANDDGNQNISRNFLLKTFGDEALYDSSDTEADAVSDGPSVNL